MISLYMLCLVTQVYSWAISDVLSENNHFQFPNTTASIKERIIMANGKWDYMDPDYYYIGDFAFSLLELILAILAMACCCPIMCCLACCFYAHRRPAQPDRKFKNYKKQPLLSEEQPIYDHYDPNHRIMHGEHSARYSAQIVYVPHQYPAPGYVNIQPSAPSLEHL
jgi:hypothetical protein